MTKQEQQHRILIANRGEIAIRIARACADLGIPSVAVFAEDDRSALHVLRADQSHLLPGNGVNAYLDIQAIINAARSTGCTAIHPGYGFLSESSAFVEACDAEGLVFIGPTAETISVLGDKARARELAAECNVPVCDGTGPISLSGAKDFFGALKSQSMLIKAVAGGGGRGMRIVTKAEDIDHAWQEAGQEALKAFGCSDVYCEELIAAARHIEVQVLGDGTGTVVHFGERECSVQRRHQKLIEIAPSPRLDENTRRTLLSASCRMAKRLQYRGLGTFEFLLDAKSLDRFVFIEANPRVQVEHTVTEEVYGVDLVQAQIKICLGDSLEALGFTEESIGKPQGQAIQLRINAESMQVDGKVLPAIGQIQALDTPMGAGIRIDGMAYVGYRNSPNYDSLLAKLIVHDRSNDLKALVSKAARAIREYRIEGLPTNRDLLISILNHHDFQDGVTTRWTDEHLSELLSSNDDAAPTFFPYTAQADTSSSHAQEQGIEEGQIAIRASTSGSVVEINVKPGDRVSAGSTVAVLEAMKMQFPMQTQISGAVVEVRMETGSMITAGDCLVVIEPGEVEDILIQDEARQDLNHIRPDLAELQRLLALTEDSARPDAVERRHAQGGRTARENIADLVDLGSFIEYGQLIVAAQRTKHSMDKLRQISPADGLVGGLATVNAELFDADKSQVVVAAYDYTVMAGTQGSFNHKKQDRLFQLAAELRRPVVLFAEGGGGRPDDIDKHKTVVAGLDFITFKAFGRLSGLVPTVGIVNGRCFAGNAALAGCCDVIIATRNANIGMGGPVMIDGAGLGTFKPEQIGPASVQSPNGVIDVLVNDEAEAVAAAKKYLSYFQGKIDQWQAADQRLLRSAIPENRKRAYDIRALIETLADTDSVLELRRDFGCAMVTALIRIEGVPIAVMANNPGHLGGAIDADAADKAARFMQLCNAHHLPILSLCDTPGFMVGPEAEKTAQVRRFSRMILNGASLNVPVALVALRKGYGLGALAMSGGSFQDTTISLSWPSGEFGGMGLEGAVRLAFAKQLSSVEDPQKREAQFSSLVAMAYEHGKASNMASVMELDNVIDPAATRHWVLTAFRSWSKRAPGHASENHRHIESW